MAVVLLVGVEDDGGRSLIQELSKAGYRVVVAASSPVENAENVKSIDLQLPADQSTIENVVEKAWNAFGGLDSLVFYNNFQGSFGHALEVTEQEWDTTVNMNLKAAWLVSQAVAKRMKESGRGGSVVFVTSIASTDRGLFPGISVYGTCMAGIHHLSKALAIELGKYNIRVNSIVRGFGETDVVMKGLPADKSSATVARLLPLGRWANSSDFSSIVLFYIGESSSYLTGTIIPVDGGQSIVRPRLKSRI